MRSTSRLLIALPFVVMTLVATTDTMPAPDRRPELGTCQNLQVEAGHNVSFHVYAEGVQIYQWNGTSWIFQVPDATLFANIGGTGVVGTHYGGPTWESNSGSTVRGAVLERCTVDQSDIQWLLLRAASSSGPGPFHRTTFIQRVNTHGGIAPVAGGNFPGEIASVPYTTEYYFYRQQ